MKAVRITIGIVLGAALLGMGWVELFHSEWLKPAPKSEEPEPVTDVPVHVAKVTRATLHKYVECYGSAGAAQLYAGGQPSTARIASPVAGVVTDVTCSIGQGQRQCSPDSRSATGLPNRAAIPTESAGTTAKPAQA